MFAGFQGRGGGGGKRVYIEYIHLFRSTFEPESDSKISLALMLISQEETQ